MPIRLTLLLTAALLGTATAQTSTQADSSAQNAAPAQTAEENAAQTRSLADKARATYPKGSASIDQPLWKQAADAAERAVKQAPNNPEYLRLRAQIYTEVGFWKQAELGWNAYFKAGQPSEAERGQAAFVQYNLGYAAYKRNLMDQAAKFFAGCTELDPRNADCVGWSARTALEAGNYAQADKLYGQALTLKPNDKTLAYFRDLSGRAGRYGPAATRAFSRAFEDLDAGRKEKALEGFQEAAHTAANFAEAWRQAGKLALELGNAQAAATAYQGVSTLPEASAADRFNLALAQEGVQYGLNAVKTFREAYAKYAAGQKDAAAIGFQAAATQNPKYAKAWAWLGRVRYEAKDYPGATEAYGQAVQLDPNDKSSAYYLKLAQQGK
ncbi:tetratricopeptide repeat protein [Deinococcus hopiensis]|uniref:Tetratricopeptide repeat-containing protein n=1 Tax=Deinococcus hopiensis KR-140 TaxID=695939 RepID=A0A1W1V4X3_9DEIO|nr:tetratricopeptide repeat protein [Deinococcus hopiensis]SMB88363.1 Tetratricopeptide repeat-containing protein [Deinococcus hopiensis KR-140]